MNNPSISIITIVYNGITKLEETMLSVINQTYKNIEYIVIDGGSTDGSIDIIKKYENKIAYWISEPDKGIYDAMNKGINKATGEWINFMNVGDIFYNNQVLENMFASKIDFYDVIYGSVNYIDNFKNIILSPLSLRLIEKKMVFCHQASFVKRIVLIKNLFDIKYTLAADYNLFYNLYHNNAKFKQIDLCIAIYDGNGVSNIRYKQTLKEYLLIQGKWNSRRSRISYNILCSYINVKNKIKCLLPKKL